MSGPTTFQERAPRSVLRCEGKRGGLPPTSTIEKIAMGAIIEVEDGDEGRTIFLAPVGAGIELTMPDGDGFVTVVTPASPLGKAVLGRAMGDTIEVVVKGEAREWTVTFVD